MIKSEEKRTRNRPRTSMSVRDKRIRVKALKENIGLILAHNIERTGRFKLVNDLHSNTHFITHNEYAKRYVKRFNHSYSGEIRTKASFVDIAVIEFLMPLIDDLLEEKDADIDSLTDEQLILAEKNLWIVASRHIERYKESVQQKAQEKAEEQACKKSKKEELEKTKQQKAQDKAEHIVEEKKLLVKEKRIPLDSIKLKFIKPW
ncbi:hypothetical protein [Pseudomonas moraviensis]|nr:hypothetical protein [Pseudomonas moraviensis]